MAKNLFFWGHFYRHHVALLVIVAFPVIVALPVMYGIQGASKKSWFSGKSALANIDADSKKSRSNS
jgi:hypothetical protein